MTQSGHRKRGQEIRVRERHAGATERTARTGPGQRQSAYITVERGERKSTIRTEKRIDGQRSGTALAFSAVAPWERPGLAAHPILSSQRLALGSVPTIIKSCGHCGLEATDGQSRPLRRQHFDPCNNDREVGGRINRMTLCASLVDGVLPQHRYSLRPTRSSLSPAQTISCRAFHWG